MPYLCDRNSLHVSICPVADEVASLTLKRVDACLAAVEAAKSSLTDTAFFRMVMVSRQGPYLDRLVDSVARFDRTVDKYRQRELDLISQQQELSRQNQKVRGGSRTRNGARPQAVRSPEACICVPLV